MGRVAINNGGCKSISLLSETQSVQHLAGSKLKFQVWPMNKFYPNQHSVHQLQQSCHLWRVSPSLEKSHQYIETIHNVKLDLKDDEYTD